MPVDPLSLSTLLAVFSGSLVGFILGLIGSGGSILALPLLVYLVGYAGEPHMAIGTTALAVGVNALANVFQHARRGSVHFPTGLSFAAPGIVGALAGAWLGLITPGENLLFLFALLMLFVAYRMWSAGRANRGDEPHRLASWKDAHVLVRVIPAGLAVGVLSGFFGIGGGFLIVPAIAWAARADVRTAIGTSLVAVAAFGFTTAARYGFAGKLDLAVAGLFILGGVGGGVLGTHWSHRAPKDTLRHLFAGVLVIVSLYMLYRNWSVLAGAL